MREYDIMLISSFVQICEMFQNLKWKPHSHRTDNTVIVFVFLFGGGAKKMV